MSRFLVVGVVLAACGDNGKAPVASGPLAVRVLAFNDFHGAISGSTTRPGAARFAAQISALRTPNTIVIAAGDLIGASPLDSGLFHDEPTIDAMSLIGLDASAIGNHELDEGPDELLRMQNGGCHPTDGCPRQPPFAGATFPYLAANTTVKATGELLLPAYQIREIEGIKIAIVGMTLENTPSVTLASAVTSLEFHDEVETMNALLPDLRAQDANIVLLALHQGGANSGEANECVGVNGPIRTIAQAMDPAVAVIASGHSHSRYVCTGTGPLLTSAGSNGAFITSIDLEIDRATQTVLSATAENIPVDLTLEPEPAVAALVDEYVALAAPLGDRLIGSISADLTPVPSASGESALGSVITDAMLAASGGADVALMNDGGIRASLRFAKSGPETVDGQVRFAEAFAVQPFGNLLSTFEVTGTELAAALDASIATTGPLHIAGATYSWASAPAGSRVTVARVMVGGSPLVATDTYKVITNSIVIDAFPTATQVTGVGVDLDALAAYFTASSPVSPPATGRITHL